jgi:hypothetical protein
MPEPGIAGVVPLPIASFRSAQQEVEMLRDELAGEHMSQLDRISTFKIGSSETGANWPYRGVGPFHYLGVAAMVTETTGCDFQETDRDGRLAFAACPTALPGDIGSLVDPISPGSAVDSCVGACPCRRTGSHFSRDMR